MSSRVCLSTAGRGSRRGSPARVCLAILEDLSFPSYGQDPAARLHGRQHGIARSRSCRTTAARARAHAPAEQPLWASRSPATTTPPASASSRACLATGSPASRVRIPDATAVSDDLVAAFAPAGASIRFAVRRTGSRATTGSRRLPRLLARRLVILHSVLRDRPGPSN